MNSIAVIPARGGSKRLPNKNIQLLGGKPLICHTVEAVVASESFDEIVVSTDSEKIAKAVGQYPVSFHRRPEIYATDKSTVMDALFCSIMPDVPKHDIIAVLLPTCPFRFAPDIQRGMDKLDNMVDSVVSVCTYSEPPQLAMVRVGDRFIPVTDNLTSGLTNSSVIRKFYRPNGGFYIGWWDKLERSQSFFAGIVRGVLMSKMHSMDIDDSYDLRLANIMYRGDIL